MQWRGEDFTTGRLSDCDAEVVTGAGGAVILQFEVPETGYNSVCFFRDPKDGDTDTALTFEIRRTPPDLAPYWAAGWHAPLVPRPAADGTPSSVALPDTLHGNANLTWHNLALTNLSPADAETARAYVWLDGQSHAGVMWPAFPGGAVARYNYTFPYTVRGGRHTLSLNLDALNRIEELDETNNVYGEQYVWSPLGVNQNTTVNRSAPPEMMGGWPYITSGETRWYDCDGLRLSGLTGWWAAMAVMPGDTSNVDLRLHQTLDGAKQGFAANLASSNWAAGASDYVLVNFNLVARRPYDAGAIRVNGVQGYTAECVRETYLGGYPSGDYGPYAMPAGAILRLHEMRLAPGSYRFRLGNAAGRRELGPVPASAERAVPEEIDGGAGRRGLARGRGSARGVRRPDRRGWLLPARRLESGDRRPAAGGTVHAADRGRPHPGGRGRPPRAHPPGGHLPQPVQPAHDRRLRAGRDDSRAHRHPRPHRRARAHAGGRDTPRGPPRGRLERGRRVRPARRERHLRRATGRRRRERDAQARAGQMKGRGAAAAPARSDIMRTFISILAATLAAACLASAAAAQPDTRDRHIRVRGRVVCERLDNRDVPVPGTRVYLRDMNESGSFHPLESGYTDAGGYFDITFLWVPDDHANPNLRVVVEPTGTRITVYNYDGTESDVVRIESETRWNYTGSDLQLGWMEPAREQDHAVWHAFVVANRLHDWIDDTLGDDLPATIVRTNYGNPHLWRYSGEDVYLGSDHIWREASLARAYARAWLTFHDSDGPLGIAYCNDTCEAGEEVSDCFHCDWCNENARVAWVEGFCAYLADRFTADYEAAYGYPPLYEADFEALDTCGDGSWDAPDDTEGFFAALLRDIDDVTMDAHPHYPGYRDVVSLGRSAVFAGIRDAEDFTPTDFLKEMVVTYPSYRELLWETGMNCGLNCDVSAPGLVTGLDLAEPPGRRPVLRLDADLHLDPRDRRRLGHRRLQRAPRAHGAGPGHGPGHRRRDHLDQRAALAGRLVPHRPHA